MKKIRAILTSFIPYIVWTLMVSMVYSFFMYKLNSDLLDETTISAGEYYIKGLLIFIPMCVFGIAGKKSKKIWQFLIICLPVLVILYFVTNCVMFTVIASVVFIIRFADRVKSNEEIPQESILDNVSYLFVLVFVLCFVITAFTKDVFFQQIAVYHAFYVALLVFLLYGLQKFEGYIELKESKANVPSKRILDAGTKIFVVAAVLIVLVVTPIMKYEYEFFSLTMPEMTQKYGDWQFDNPVDNLGEETPKTSIEHMFEIEENPAMTAFWEFLEDFVLGGMYVILAVSLLVGIYVVVKNFNKTQVKKGDLIESTMVKDGDKIETLKAKRDYLIGFSKDIVIRRKYKKALKKYKPQQWQTPTEMEEMAKLDISELHQMYEEVRYGNKG